MSNSTYWFWIACLIGSTLLSSLCIWDAIRTSRKARKGELDD